MLLRACLLLSLLINVFAAGWWVGDLFRWHRPPPPRFSMADFIIGRLSQSGGQKAGPALQEVELLARGDFAKRHARFEQLRELVGREPLDVEAAGNLLREVAVTRLSHEDDISSRLLAILKDLSPGDRQSLVDAIARGPGPGPGPGPGGPPQGFPPPGR